MNQELKYPGIQLIQLDPDIAVLSTRLPGDLHGDPADRIIAATCMKLNIPLLTKDKRLQAWGHIKTIW